jgi:hypothetical protein
MKCAALVAAWMAALLWIVSSSGATKEQKNDMPGDLLQIETFSCTAHDEYRKVPKAAETVDAKTGKIVLVPADTVDVVTYKSDILVTYNGDHDVWKHSQEFTSMKDAANYCVGWNQRVAKAIKAARKKGKP